MIRSFFHYDFFDYHDKLLALTKNKWHILISYRVQNHKIPNPNFIQFRIHVYISTNIHTYNLHWTLIPYYLIITWSSIKTNWPNKRNYFFEKNLYPIYLNLHSHSIFHVTFKCKVTSISKGILINILKIVQQITLPSIPSMKAWIRVW